MKRSALKSIGPDGHRGRLRDRFRASGRQSLADYEMLELLLTYAIPRIDTKPIAKALLKKHKTIFNIFQQPHERLMETKGIGAETATYLRVIQACLTIAMETEVERSENVSKPEDIFAFVRMNLGPCATECLYTFYLDDARQIVHHQEVALGTVNRLPVYPREILKPALLNNATGIILVHNHPDGQPVPSESDFELTKKIEDISKMFDIALLDHLVVTKLSAYSIKTGKLL